MKSATMSTQKFDSFKDLRKGKYDWKVKARVLNLWRGFRSTGEAFKGFNLLLLDNRRARIHAWVPSSIEDHMEGILEVGYIYLFQNFTVKDYKPTEKFRCLRKDIQIVFSSETKIEHLNEAEENIEHCWFDFYDIADLETLANQTKYLTDVIGVMEIHNPIGKIMNKHGRIQSQMKFKITDGSRTVQITFWDEFAELFADFLQQDLEYPRILIVGCGRVQKWGEQVNITNVGATTFYLNSTHHSAVEMRRRISEPTFDQTNLSLSGNRGPILYTIAEIQNMEASHIETQVLCQLKLTIFHQVTNWCVPICTSCYQKLELINNVMGCQGCNRTLPHAETKFQLNIWGVDETGRILIGLEDREVRTLIGKTVYELIDEGNRHTIMPEILNSLQNKNYTVKLTVSEDNINKKELLYVATDIMEGFYSEYNNTAEESYPHPISDMEPEQSTSIVQCGSVHLGSDN